MDKKVLMTAIRAAVDAGGVIMDVYDNPAADIRVERKADNSPLTIADCRSNAVIEHALSATPYPLLSEEGSAVSYAERCAWRSMWIVDPLDGTKEFIRRNGNFTVNIAYVEDNKPCAGVIYVPVSRTLYFADVSVGAFRIETLDSIEPGDDFYSLKARATRLPCETSSDTFVVVASHSHKSVETEQYIAEMKRLHGRISTVERGSSVKLCLIAEGSADVYPRFAPTMEWDTAAGHAIVRAAGRDVYNAEKPDEPLQYNKADLHNPWFIAR